MRYKHLLWLPLPALLLVLAAVPIAQAQDDSQTTSYRSGYDQGYPRGFDQGKSDHGTGTEFDLEDHRDFRDAEAGYSTAYGSKSDFKKGFRAGFELGYQDGYSGKDPQIATAPSPPPEPLAQEVIPSPEQEMEVPSGLARADAPVTTSAYSSGWDQGYKNGYKDGKDHHDTGTEFDPKDAPEYKGYRSSYDSSVGKRSHYKEGYKDGFKEGYRDGYSGLMSRLVSPPAPAQSEAAAPAMEATPGEPEQPEIAMQEQPAQEPLVQPQALPRSLPKTASGLPLLGLVGLAGIALSLLFRVIRNKVV